MALDLDRIISAAVGGLITAGLAAAGFTVAERQSPKVAGSEFALVVNGLTELHAKQASETRRWRCKYRRAASEAASRGWEKPATRSAWDAVCTEDAEP